MADSTLTLLNTREGYQTIKLVELSSGLYALAVAVTTAQAENLGVHLEDAAHASGDPGVQMLSVRKDSAAATAGADGDYQPIITDSAGRLWVRLPGSDVTNGVQKVAELESQGTSRTSSGVSVAASGVLTGVLVGNAHATDACTVTVYDNDSAASGTVLGVALVIPALTAPYRINLYLPFSIGVYFGISGGTGSAQALYRQVV